MDLLVIVHPSYPWISSDKWEEEKKHWKRVKQTLSYIFSSAKNTPHTLVTPDSPEAVGQTHYQKGIQQLHTTAAAHFRAYSDPEFSFAAREIYRWLQRQPFSAQNIQIAGFWRDLCCFEMEIQLQKLGLPASINERLCCPAPY